MGFPCDYTWAAAASQLLCELTMGSRGVVPLPGSEILHVNPIQKMIYGKFMKMHFASDIRMTIRSRLIDLLVPFSFDIDNQIAPCIALLPNVRAGKAITVSETWINR